MEQVAALGKSVSQSRGSLGEDRALGYLLKKGYKLIARNWRCKMGEIDLIMDDGRVRVMVEVRSRARTKYGAGLDTVAYQKQMKLVRTAKFYQQKESYWGDMRFDVVSIEIQLDGTYKIEQVENAFMVGS